MDTTIGARNDATITGIPGYRVERFIARGGMGDVYLARDEALQRFAAIKFIHPDFSNDPEYQSRFKHEAVTVANFDHPNIVTVYGSGWLNGQQYISMEYVAGGTLEEVMSAGRLTEARAIDIAHRMADALAYAHEREVIHRDFKPRNILLRKDGSPVLSDFGVAKSDVTKSEKTAAGVVIGNLRYMAPEQALGRAISNRIDVYSLGLVLYEMLTGKMPGTHPVRTKSDERAIAQAAGNTFSPFIIRCLRDEPDARPPAAECRAWLECHSQARPPPKPRLAMMAGALIGIAAAIGLGVFMLHRSMAGIALDVQRLPLTAKVFIDRRPVSGSSAHLAPGSHEIAAIAPGYYGELKRVTLAAGRNPQAVEFALEPTRLPSRADEERFIKLADAPRVTEADVASVVERTLNTALRAKILYQGSAAKEFDGLAHDVDVLRSLGDTRAAVAGMIIDGIKKGTMSGLPVTQSLLTASENGDAMASIFVAANFRESIGVSATPVSATDPRFRRYCHYVGLAVEQGWTEVASMYWQRDRCAN